MTNWRWPNQKTKLKPKLKTQLTQLTEVNQWTGDNEIDDGRSGQPRRTQLLIDDEVANEWRTNYWKSQLTNDNCVVLIIGPRPEKAINEANWRPDGPNWWQTDQLKPVDEPDSEDYWRKPAQADWPISEMCSVVIE